jgi:hypothetical protein
MKIALFCRRSALFAIPALLLAFAGCSSVETAPSGRREHPEPGKALVVFYREDHVLGSTVEYKVRDGAAYPTAKIGALPNGSYFTYQAAPGQHIFLSSTEVQQTLVKNLDAGRTYYIRGGVHPGVVIWRPDLREVSHAEGVSAISSLQKVQLIPKKGE